MSEKRRRLVRWNPGLRALFVIKERDGETEHYLKKRNEKQKLKLFLFVLFITFLLFFFAAHEFL